MPIEFHLVCGNDHEAAHVDVLIDLLDCEPRAILMDKGFIGDKIAQKVRDKGAIPVIPPKVNAKVKKNFFPRTLYKARSRVENFFARLKKFRRIEFRFDKKARNFLSFIQFAAGIIWCKQFIN